uniref:Uncharacterized protein n=1 Tax=Oryza brachyantha TaxID=4533 RepID=J3LRL1_ORYBR
MWSAAGEVPPPRGPRAVKVKAPGVSIWCEKKPVCVLAGWAGLHLYLPRSIRKNVDLLRQHRRIFSEWLNFLIVVNEDSTSIGGSFWVYFLAYIYSCL